MRPPLRRAAATVGIAALSAITACAPAHPVPAPSPAVFAQVETPHAEGAASRRAITRRVGVFLAVVAVAITVAVLVSMSGGDDDGGIY